MALKCPAGAYDDVIQCVVNILTFFTFEENYDEIIYLQEDVHP